MRWIEDTMNAITDQDWAWYPFVSLRPEKHEVMNNRFTLLVTLYFTPVAGAIFAFFLVFFPNMSFLGIQPQLFSFFAFLLYFFVGFFVIFRLTTVVAWNNRARRVNKQKHSTQLVLE